MDSRLASISLESTGCAADTADMKTVQTARLGLEMIIRRLITLSTFLPILPSMLSIIAAPRLNPTISHQ